MTPKEFRANFDALTTEMSRVVVGYQQILTDLLMGVFAGGNILLEAPPGLGKTLIGKALAAALGMKQTRIQFTPDLMPADIVGTNIIVEDESGKKELVFQPGPVFTHVLLADEINRATPKTQSALLEAMQEKQITVARQRYPLKAPFFVMATQNPIEQEGTYPLPEAQLDRFLFKVPIAFPSRDDERQMVRLHGHRTAMPPLSEFDLQPLADRDLLAAARETIAAIRLSEPIADYVVDLVRATRERPAIRAGASSRAVNMLATAARAYAVLAGRDFVLPDDVKALAVPSLCHRLLLAPAAEIEGLTADAVLRQILEEVPAPR
jgi:MoxR-like ATPase